MPPADHPAFTVASTSATWLSMEIDCDGAACNISWETAGHVFDGRSFDYTTGTIGDLAAAIAADGNFTVSSIDPTSAARPGTDMKTTSYTGVTPQPRHASLLAFY